MAEKRKIFVYDCTLRDGTQGENVSLSVNDKLHIAQRLDDFGIDYIEGGWPGSNPRDVEFFEQARRLNWKHSRIVAFGSTRHGKNRVEEDPNIRALLEAETPVVTVVGKSWDLHVDKALKVTLQQNLEMIGESVAYLRQQGREVVFDAEHFFDGYSADSEYATAVLDAAQRAGADWITLCDTNGGTLPDRIAEVTALLLPQFPRLGIHTHNDCELAVANSIAAVGAGAAMVQGTINGFGERVGNANLTSILPVLELKLGHLTVGPEKLQGLASLAYYVSETANLPLPNNLPFVGKSAFAHKGGIHVSAILKDPRTYEHLQPEAVGNRRRVLISDLSGRSNLLYKIEEFGDISARDLDLKPLLDEIKKLEFEGYQFEGAEASFKLLLQKFAGRSQAPFSVKGFRVHVDQAADGEFSSEAVVKIHVNGVEEHTAANGNGPVHALDRAVKKALLRFFPELGETHLIDYKVRVLDAQNGTGAKVRVLIETADSRQSWTTVGVSHNIIEASWKAIIDSILYKLSLAESNVATPA